MTLDHYVQLIKGINDQLQAIGEMAAAQGWAEGAEISNPQFVALMKQHERLALLSGQITSQVAALAAAHVSGLPAAAVPREEERAPGKAGTAVVIHMGGAAPVRFVPGLSHVAAPAEEAATPAAMAAGARRYALQAKR